MITTRLVGLLGSTLAVAGLFRVAPQEDAALSQLDANRINREPIVVFDVSGGTLAGPTFEHLTVYDDGFASYSNVSAFSRARVEGKSIRDNGAERLILNLIDAGAADLTDQDGMVMDVPLSTLTIFRGGTNSQAHTYSYWLGVNGHEAVDNLLSEFISEHFPE